MYTILSKEQLFRVCTKNLNTTTGANKNLKKDSHAFVVLMSVLFYISFKKNFLDKYSNSNCKIGEISSQYCSVTEYLVNINVFSQCKSLVCSAWCPRRSLHTLWTTYPPWLGRIKWSLKTFTPPPALNRNQLLDATETWVNDYLNFAKCFILFRYCWQMYGIQPVCLWWMYLSPRLFYPLEWSDKVWKEQN